MLGGHAGQVRRERFTQQGGEQRGAVLLSLAVADGDLAAAEIQVLRPQTHGLQQTQAGAVGQRRDQPGRTLHFRQQQPDFTPRQDHGHAHGALGAHQTVEPVEVDSAGHAFTVRRL